jgi:hypothetical protein
MTRIIWLTLEKVFKKIIVLGNTLLQLNHLEEAIIYLDKCLSINKNYKFA